MSPEDLKLTVGPRKGRPVETVTVKVSQPYMKIAGGRGGLHPVGLRRDYTVTYRGHAIKNTSKAVISTLIRQYARQAGVRAVIEFEQAG